MKFVLEFCLITFDMLGSVVACHYSLVNSLRPSKLDGIMKASGLTPTECYDFYGRTQDTLIDGLKSTDYYVTGKMLSTYKRATAGFSEYIWTMIKHFYSFPVSSADFFQKYCPRHFGITDSYLTNPWAVANRATVIGTYGVDVYCADGGKHLDITSLCDGQDDCPLFGDSGLGADEKLCFHEHYSFTNDAGVAVTSTGKMVHIRKICDQVQDLDDNSDEDQSALLSVGLRCSLPPLKTFLKSPFFKALVRLEKKYGHDDN